MTRTFRDKFGPVVVSLIIGLIAIVFVFTGVFTDASNSLGLGGGGVAGKVNGETITLGEFNRELNRRMEMFKSMGGGSLTAEQLKMFRIREGVFSELVNRKLMRQAAEERGLLASNAEVREKVMEIPAFQKDGKFDKLTYKRVLEANSYTPGGFERVMREDLTLQQWGRYFRSRVQVSEPEARNEFLMTNDLRNIKYVLLTPDMAAKEVPVSAEEIQKHLADSAKLNVAQGIYDRGKETTYKGKKFDEAKDEIARQQIAATKAEELKKATDALAQTVAASLSADKGADARVNAIVKPYGTEVKSTGLIARNQNVIQGAGDTSALMAEAYKPGTELSQKAQTFPVAGGILVAVVAESKQAKPEEFAQKREQLLSQLTSQKERELQEAFLDQLREKASIDRNDRVVSDEQG